MYWLSLVTMGVSFIASGFSGQPRPLSQLITQGMEHPGFSIVHVQSPCTTYNDTFDVLKGNAKKGIEPQTYAIDDSHDPENLEAAFDLVQKPVPLGVVYKAAKAVALDERFEQVTANVKGTNAEQLIKSLAI